MAQTHNHSEQDDEGWRLPAGSGERWADDYELGRPSYPREVAHASDLPSSSTVLDLGAGTGKLTRVLTKAFDHVVAVEPADAMRRILELEAPGAEVLEGRAQQIPLSDDSVDAVFAAEAFHRFNEDQSISEIARVLRAGGALVLLWNVPEGPWEPSVDAAEELLRQRMPPVDYIPLDLGGPRDALEALNDGPFEPLQEIHFPNPQAIDREGLIAFYASMGWVGDLPDDRRLPLLEEVRSRLVADSYRRQWRTDVYWVRLKGDIANR